MPLKVIEHFVQVRRFAERRKQPLESIINSWPWSGNGKWGGLVNNQCLQFSKDDFLQGTVRGKGERGNQKKNVGKQCLRGDRDGLYYTPFYTFIPCLQISV